MASTWEDDDRAPLQALRHTPAGAPREPANVAKDVARMQSENRGASDNGAEHVPHHELDVVAKQTDPEVLFSNGILRSVDDEEDGAEDGAGPEDEDPGAPGWSCKFMYT